MIHFTLTGPYAGLTFCGISRHERKAEERYIHLPGSAYLKTLLDGSELCPECRALYEEVGDCEEEDAL